MFTAARIYIGNSGFTLIETMLALMVLVIGIVGVFGMQMVTVRGNANAISLSRAVLESSAVVDEIESLSYDDSSLDEATNINMTTLFGVGNIPSFKSNLTYDVTVEPDLKTRFNLQNEAFATSTCKVITVTSVRRVNGQDKNTSSFYYKFNATSN